MAKRKMTKTSYIITYILLVLLLVAVVGVIAYFTNGFTSEIKTFYVECEGKNILTEKDGYILSKDKPLVVNVKYPFEIDDKAKGYTLRIVSNKIEGKDFDIKSDNIDTTFFSIKDLSKGFDIKQDVNSFTITPKGRINEVLQAVFPDKTIGDYRKNTYKNMFSLIVTTKDKTGVITLNFSLEDEVLVKEILLNQEALQL